MCSLFGLIDFKNSLTPKQRNKYISVLAKECEVRGTDATGIAYNYADILRIYKRPLPAHRMGFRIPKEANIIMGHTRMTTQGSEKKNFNNHPFFGRCDGQTFERAQSFALAHNGVLYNDSILRKKLKLPSSNIETDSYIAVQLIEQQKTLDLANLKEMAEQVEGSFCFTVLDNEDNFYFVKGDNPLCIYKFGGFYIYASTEEILQKALKKLKVWQKYEKIPMMCGEILKVDSQGFQEWEEFNPSHLALWDYPPRRYMNLLASSKPEEDRTLLDEIMDYAKSIGISPNDITMLLEFGYDEFEIEELLYDPLELQTCLQEVYEAELEYYYERICL